MAKIRKIIFKHRYPFILFLISAFIAYKSFTPGTFLTGWDTLHPEFDFGLNFKRLISGVWREEQGLGTVAAHSHMADLPRVLILWLLNIVFPLNSLRYLYIYLCLITGVLGVYYLISFLLQKKEGVKKIAFSSALFYLFNPATAQQFYVPFEMFPTQFATLPWILYSSLKFLNKPNRRNLLLFSIFTFFSIPQAYAAHLWYPFFGIFLIFIVLNWLLQKPKIKLKSIITLTSLALIINSFWLLPNLYYISTSSEAPRINRTNRLHSQEFRLKNRETGYLKDVIINRGFYFNWEIFDFNYRRSTPLMPEWKHHYQNHDILLIGYSFFLISLIGLTASFFHRDKKILPLAVFLIIPFAFLANRLPLFRNIFDLLQTLPILDEALRFVYTKFACLFQMGITVFFALGLVSLSQQLKNKKNFSRILVGIVILVTVYAAPFLQGSLISPKIKIKIPQSYFDFWKFMKDQPKGLVLTLPLHQSSGWQYYDWQYQGSGFIWFGLKQSVLDRDFDRWETKNEQSFRELYSSLYAYDTDMFEKVINKYDIKYLAWDQSLTTTAAKNIDQITFKKETGNIINHLLEKGLIIYQNSFGPIKLYQIVKESNPLTTHRHINNYVSPSYLWGYSDAAFNQTGDYVSLDFYSSNIYYPFRNVLNKYNKIDLSLLSITKNQGKWDVRLNQPPSPFYLLTPPLEETEKEIFASVIVKKSEENKYLLKLNLALPSFLKKGAEDLVIESPEEENHFKITINYHHLEIDKTELESGEPKNIGWAMIYPRDNYINGEKIHFNSLANVQPSPQDIHLFNTPVIEFDAQKIYELNQGSFGISLKTYDQTKVRYFALNSTRGTNFRLEKLPHFLGYIIGLKTRNITGIPLRFCLKNLYSNLCAFEDEVEKNKEFAWDYFLIPAMDNSHGYHLLLHGISYADTPSVSEVEKIVIIPLPYRLLSAINYQNYKAPDFNRYLVLNQSYNLDWLAFYFQGIKPIFLKNHVLVNNWANGWELNQLKMKNEKLKIKNKELKVYIFFWPQLLQFLGFGLLLAVPLIILKTKRKN